MDVQMPAWTATSHCELRRLEVLSGGHIPIVALTANAMPGDRERRLLPAWTASSPPMKGELLQAIKMP
jgi:CheY-like chemotaxis protein